ncbi:MAG: glycosyltransferase family 2 protein [Microthrixaceae bacterium]|nr:glycosyltransferase family 2 protein [Microthrixaceae bacterium]
MRTTSRTPSRSVLAQDFEDFELVIADNGSTDGTEEMARAAVAADERVRYDRSPVNRGATWNYNRLVASTDAEFFKWSAHDDMLAPRFLSACVAELDRSPNAVLAYPRTVLIDAEGDVQDDDFVDGLDLRDADPLIRFRRYMVHIGEQHAVFGLIRRSALLETGLIANCWGGDQVVLAELLVKGTFNEVPERLFLRRYHPETSMVANRTPAEVATWYDPTRRSRRALPRTRLTVELAKAAGRAAAPSSTRVKLRVAVLRYWVPHYWRTIGGEMKAALFDVVRRRTAE